MKRDNRDKSWTDAINERLSEGGTPAPDELWSRVQLSVAKRERVLLKRGVIAISSVVAAVVILLLVIPKSVETTTLPIEEQSTITSAKEHIRPDAVAEVIESSSNEADRALYLPTKESGKRYRIVIEDRWNTPETEVVEHIEENKVIEKVEYIPTKRYDKPETTLTTIDDKRVITKKRVNTSRFKSVSFSRATFSSVESAKRYYDTAPPYINTNGSTFGDDVPPEIVARYSTASFLHKPPVSYMVKASYELLSRLHIEGGVSYTALYSTLKLPDSKSGIEQAIHYIGIPIGINVPIISSRIFGIYCTLGAVAEYCVGATLGGYNVAENRLALSVNASIGGNVNITKDCALFIEQAIEKNLTDSVLKSYRDCSRYFTSLKIGFRIKI